MDPAPIDPAVMQEMRERLAQPQPCTASGWTVGGYARPVWTPGGFLARGDRYLLTCPNGHRREAPLQALIDAGRGDLPMHTFHWRCPICGADGATVELDLRSRRP
ncbi:MAG TPA: hypothetical protein VL358_04435 [Caulobacteraceae bacterium]|jgi:hypothetical protein|nr:hypothetical protein [Caulobacteraceae bacterium]